MKKVLLVQTGGTIAMDITENNIPQLDITKGMNQIYKKIPALSDIAQLESICPFFEDSSDIGLHEWKLLIKCIDKFYDDYDGFVILHGTDTMAYTASALSFGLQDLSKPVILTGSQVPMAKLRSDARRNLVNAIEMATLPLPEVAICFNDFVYRGNRTTKMSIGDFDAFASPNYPPLAEIGLDIKLNKNYIRNEGQHRPPIKNNFSDAVFLLKIYPGLSPAFLERIDLTGIDVIVVESFGSGNFPISGDSGLLPFLKKCIKTGIVLVFTSQAAYDAVDLSIYKSGRTAAEMGAVSAGDMTTEATLTKIMYLLENCSSDGELIKLIQTNIAGELSN